MSIRRFGSLVLALLLAQHAGISFGLTTPLNLMLVTPSDGVNQALLTLSTDSAGTDSDTVTFSGDIRADLDFQFVNGQVVPTGLSFTGGNMSVSDATFRLFFGFVSVQSTGLAGTPTTLAPPGLVTGNTFAASDHQITVNQGQVTAAGSTFDFAKMPSVFSGEGTGTLDISTMPGPGPLPAYIVDVSLSLPVEVDQDFFVENAPVVGDINATLTGSTAAVATQQLILSLIVGDYNQNEQFDCGDAALLADAVATSSTDLTFDANLDGSVNQQDVRAWATDLVGTLPGDANLDMQVDGTDFAIWSSNKFTNGANWCSGDFDGDGTTAAHDFLTWNQFNNSTSSSAVQSASVPESQSGLLVIVFIAGLRFHLRRREV